jgi:RNA polymerase sigma factor (sigma-70 family)
MFPATRHSILAAVRSDDAEVRARGLEALARTYWKPVYKYVRVRWGATPQDAEDLTQEFFGRALAQETFARYDARQARFRTFLRLCLDGVVANERKAARRLKRGGGTRTVPLHVLDFAGAEGEVRRQAEPVGMDPEEYFRREWVRSLFGIAVETLRERCESAGKHVHFALFERYDLDGDTGVHESRVTYARLAEQFGIPVTQVTNHLAFVRREFRRIVLEQLRDLSASDEEFRADALDLLGVDTA